MVRVFVILVCLVMGPGCTEIAVENAPVDAGQEAENETDASEPENNDEDSTDASQPVDSTDPCDVSDSDDPSDLDDGEEPAAGFGEISGACGILDLMTRQQSESLLVQNAIDFAQDPYDDSDLGLLTEGGREIISDGNAGGSSLLSEVFSFEVLARCEGAELLKTETEIIYLDPAGKKTDLLVMVGTSKLGVSVTRAVGWPRDEPYTVETAEALLIQKLSGVNASSLNVSDADSWVKQILHIVAYAHEHAQSLEEAYGLLAEDIRDDTIVIVTVSDGDDEFLY